MDGCHSEVISVESRRKSVYNRWREGGIVVADVNEMTRQEKPFLWKGGSQSIGSHDALRGDWRTRYG